MRKKDSQKYKLKVADETKTPSEIYSILLKGVLCSLKTVFLSYYVSENIEALMRYVTERKLLSAEEYKRLLNEAKDFYPVIICALFINPIKKHTKGFKLNELPEEAKIVLFTELNEELSQFFADWLCDIEIDPLLFYRLALSYHKSFNMELAIKANVSGSLTAIEEQVAKGQLVDILALYLIEQVATHLGMAGLDYIDYFKTAAPRMEEKMIETHIS